MPQDSGVEIDGEVAEARPILVWSFSEAPPLLKQIHFTDDDVDWIALIPHEFFELWGDIPPWMRSGTPFAYCDAYEYHNAVEDFVVVVGVHA